MERYDFTVEETGKKALHTHASGFFGSSARMGLGASHNANLRTDEIKYLSKNSTFTGDEISRLYTRFRAIDRGQKGYVTRADMLKIPELAMNPLMDRIVDVFRFLPDLEAAAPAAGPAGPA